jgi:uncharacterized membrane protein YoaK (UPF0700 family)
MGVDCGNTVELVMRIIKHYAETTVGRRGYRVVFIDTVMVREFIRRLNCNHRRGLTGRISHALACIAVRYGGFFTVNGNNLWIDLPIATIAKAPETELLRVVYECTKKSTWYELKKAKNMQ